MAESYYAARSRRDPAWRDAQIASATERDRRRREEDPEHFLVLARAKQARYRERLRRDPERLAAERAKAAERERERRQRLSQEERAAQTTRPVSSVRFSGSVEELGLRDRLRGRAVVASGLPRRVAPR